MAAPYVRSISSSFFFMAGNISMGATKGVLKEISGDCKLFVTLEQGGISYLKK